jgi:hypothetical protein
LTALPRDLTDLGWKLIDRGGRLFAVSTRWGGTVASQDIEDVISNARAMTRYIQWRMDREAEQRQSIAADV